MAVTEKKLVQRSQRVAFMDVGAGGSAEYTRMTGFTALTNGKNPKEYSRQYVDENTERSDVVGYSPSIEYSFDRHTNTLQCMTRLRRYRIKRRSEAIHMYL